jgi:S1-C subfamily serine protease
MSDVDRHRRRIRSPSASLAEPPPPGPPRVRPIPAAVRRSGLFVAGVLATFVAVAAYGALNPPPRPLSARDIDAAVGSILASQTPPPPNGEIVFDIVRPSLVLIETEAKANPDGSPGGGLGSGVVVNEAGAVLTALHVVEGASEITVTFADGSKSGATIAVEQPENDIALLEPSEPPARVIPATLGNPAAMRIGSEAYVVGNPFGLYGSLSGGVVSGLDRSFTVPDSDQVIHGLIQVDAAINRGNSGGPLLDRLGRVVGIVTALVNPTEDGVFIGIGFAVPIDVAGGAAGVPAY